jgi:steroid 5-alpha reductase family enzyme
MVKLPKDNPMLSTGPAFNLHVVLILWFKAGLVILVLMTLLWLTSLALKNSSIVDIFWGMGFVIIFWISTALVPGGLTPRLILLASLTSIWGLRLSLYIYQRNHGKPEDFRYAAWRREAGSTWWWRSFFKVFLLQGLLMWIIATPLLAAQTGDITSPLFYLDYSGAALWLVGFIFEAGGDIQLARFKNDPANNGKLLTTGLWSITRHPNYFGDAAQWWGFYLVAAASGALWTVFSPIMMTYLLMKVSGVIMLERILKQTKPGYAEYITRTSAFFPWFPAKK